MPYADPDRLRAIKTFPQLVKYLHDELEWPIEQESFDDLTFDYSPEELGLDPKTAVKVKEIKQLRPLSSHQPWGIFFLQFEPKRLPVVVLRRILQALVLKKRASAAKAHQAAWNLHDLLFISSYGESDHRDISFAHFAEEEDSALPTLKVLGWDDEDTVLHLDHAHQTLQEKLRWPEGDADIKAWRERWASAFTLRHREVITTSKEMAVRLAHLATAIRKRVNQILVVETEQGALRQLMKGFREALIHDLTEDDFADMYAQTVTYGLLTARISQPKAYASGGLTDLPITNPFLRDLLSQFMRVGGRKGKLNFDELGIHEVVQTLLDADMPAVLRDFGDKNPQEDPVVHFYELFLKEYDPRKRTSRGVFYTPRPVVSYIVRSVHELLQSEFGLEDGLADTATWGDVQKRFKDLKLPLHAKASDPFVRILDPATGTGTFLVECIEVIHGTMTEKWRKQGHYNQKAQDLWNDYVPKHLLPRLYGFELMMAPYAIAHMKIGLKLFETGYRFGADERARIYLTNSLEPPGEVSVQSLFEESALAHEAQAVNAVKKGVPFTVVIGNPPYANFGQMNKIPFILDALEEYKRGLGEKKINLDDDFIKFVRWGHLQISQSKCGILGMITNNVFLDGLTHRRMRKSLQETFLRIEVLDLHGNAAAQETAEDGSIDENVFDIVQGVSISIMCSKAPVSGSGHHVRFAELCGTRESKFKRLMHERGHGVELAPVPPYFFFTPKDLSMASEYSSFVPLQDAFNKPSYGIQTKRDAITVALSAEEITKHAEFMLANGDDAVRRKYELPDDGRDWAIRWARQDLARIKNLNQHVHSVLYRPFDIRWTIYTNKSKGFLAYPRWDTMRCMLNSNLGLIAMRQVFQDVDVYSHFGVTSTLIDERTFYSNRGGTYLFPLYRASDTNRGLLNGEGRGGVSNWSASFMKRFGDALGSNSRPTSAVSDEDIFTYTYSAFNSPTFRYRYGELLKIDFPRIPLTSSLPLFRALAKLGSELVGLHLMEFLLEDEKPKNPAAKEWPVYPRLTEFIGKVPSIEVEKVSYGKKTVWLDKAQSVGFKGVPEEVWQFHIGGYQVCNKWLKDRKGRHLCADDVLHYHKIVTALSNTIRLMKDIDKVIDKHGGWPGAFSGADA